MTHLGNCLCRQGEYERAVEYFTKAAELGDLDAHYYLGIMYEDGQGVEKDEKKALYYGEQAAIGGHPFGRWLLGKIDHNHGKFKRAAKHFIIAAKLLCYLSLQEVTVLFMQGIVSKEEYAASLRAHQAAVDATKSVTREVAEKAKSCCPECYRESCKERSRCSSCN